MTDQRALELFDFDTLEGTTITFSYYQRQKIREELLFGQRKDIMREKKKKLEERLKSRKSKF